MKNIWLLILFTSIQVIGRPQVSISGRVLDDNGKPAVNVSITLHPYHNPKNIISYTFSQDDGTFCFTKLNVQGKAILSFHSMEFADTSLIVSPPCKNVEITLKPKLNRIDEVKVTNSPIRVKGDTISYLVSSFASANDFSVGDVIEKLPGFNVDESGAVYYQGKKISTYYIEGLDLLEDNYTLANKNLPHSSVAAVDVLKNHQSIKALGKIIPSNDVAINIRLKNNITITGAANGTIGVEPLLWNGNITPMIFNKNQQLIASWQGNNLGEKLSTQFSTLTFKNGSMSGSSSIKKVYVSIPNIFSPKIGNAILFDNISNLYSLNYLNKSKSELELKVNLSYLNEEIDQHKVNSVSYFLNDSIVSISEDQGNSELESVLKGDVTISKNVSDLYLKNKINYTGYWPNGFSKLASLNGQNSVKALPNHQTFSNNLDLLLPINDNFINIISDVDYDFSPQKLKILAPNTQLQSFGSDIIQNINSQSFRTMNTVYFNIPIGKTNLFPSVTFDYDWLNHETYIDADGLRLDNDSLKNSLTWHKTGVSVSNKISINPIGKVTLNVSTPFSLYYVKASNESHHKVLSNKYLFFNPTASLKFKPLKLVELDIFGGLTNRLEDPLALLSGYTIAGYRSLSAGGNHLDKTQSFFLSIDAKYNSSSSGFIGYLGYNYSNLCSKYMKAQTISGDGFVISSNLQNLNTSISKSLSGGISFYVLPIKTTLKLDGEIRQSELPSYLNGQEYTMIVKSYVVEPKINIGYSKYWNASISSQLNLSEYSFQSSFSTTIESNNSFNFFIYIKKSHIIGEQTNWYYTKSELLGTNSALMTNLYYKYKPKKSRFDIEFRVRNVFDSKQFVQLYTSDSQISRTIYFVQPRQFLLSIQWSLGSNR
ncbi:carboxypeptidase-like regulatory domain-containing protein [Tenuifilum thalassicum]|uniref:Carboxypeptidase regulatory-like domain-containing protein n=1 Tax=Tenuifilum thalassicum TaxID=2590900 RepID=A0A7D3Y4W6_9BACT|nr:carboxypeptidase-like regulatory domain-containing protein [Tenuifilum thalassicum]QKG80289.1 carboxypeptidase regulatory-like domain-containing protein [Tenuifilum thalassicum]